MSDHDGLLATQNVDIPSVEVTFAVESREKDSPYPWQRWCEVLEGEIPWAMAEIDRYRTRGFDRNEYRLVEITKKTLH